MDIDDSTGDESLKVLPSARTINLFSLLEPDFSEIRAYGNGADLSSPAQLVSQPREMGEIPGVVMDDTKQSGHQPRGESWNIKFGKFEVIQDEAEVGSGRTQPQNEDKDNEDQTLVRHMRSRQMSTGSVDSDTEIQDTKVRSSSNLQKDAGTGDPQHNDMALVWMRSGE